MRILSNNEMLEVLDAEKYRESREQYVDRKTKEGFKIYTPAEDELLLDIDSEEALSIFKVRFDRLKEELYESLKYNEEPIYSIRKSSTLGHYHIVVKLPFELETMERIAVQAVLGSDPIREMLSIYRAWRNDPFPTLLAMKEE